MVSTLQSRSLLKYAAIALQALLLLSASAGAFAAAVPAAQSIIHGLDYLAVDYPGVIANGQIVNPGEYAEQQEIVAHTRSQVQVLPASDVKTALQQRMATLQQAIDDKAPGDQVATLSREAITLVMENFDIELAPREAPNLAAAQQLFQTECAGCHGVEGLGNGPMARELDPPPANFHNAQRQQQRSLLGLFNTVSLGVEGTAMRAFTELSTEQRWALAFYVANFASSEGDRAAGERLWQQASYQGLFSDLQSLTKPTPNEVRAQVGGEGVQLMAYLRQRPELLQRSATAPLDISFKYLATSLAQYRAGNAQDAYQQALAAYLEGFELVERKLNSLAPDLRSTIEEQMIAYRSLLKDQAPGERVEPQYQKLVLLLDQARNELQAGSASPTVSFFAAALILLREGLEAILVLAAIIALLAKAGRNDAIRYIHVGWVSALLLGGVTWFAAEHLIDVSGAHREITEGVTALIAAGMLLYVGFWLHNQAHSQRWQQFIHSKISSAVGTGTLWGLSSVAFVAVYREVFETILFYRSMWMGSQAVEHNYMLTGIVVAATLLLVLGWLVMRLSVRLPLKRFFKINTALMFVLAVVFAGKGVAAMQEAGAFPIDPINFPRVDILGIYPSLQSLGAQLLLVGGVALWGLYGFVKTRRMREASV